MVKEKLRMILSKGVVNTVLQFKFTKKNENSLVHAGSKCMMQDLLLWLVSSKFLLM